MAPAPGVARSPKLVKEKGNRPVLAVVNVLEKVTDDSGESWTV